MAAFRVLDADADGYISKADLEKVLMVQFDVQGQAAKVIQDAPTDAHGRIDFESFMKIMSQ